MNLVRQRVGLDLQGRLVAASENLTLRARLVAGGVLLILVGGLIPFAVLTAGSWRDLLLNLIAEVVGAGLIFFVIDRLLKAAERQRLKRQRREAIEDLRFVLEDLRNWLVRNFFQSGGALTYWAGEDVNRLPVEALIENFADYLGKIDFASPGLYKRDGHFIEWARRSFAQTVRDFERWERNFAGAAGLFDEDFRTGAERLHDFIRAMGSFLEGMERYILRTQPTSPVHAYGGVTELDEKGASRLVHQLRDFLAFYRQQCEKYGAEVPNLDLILK